MAITASYLPPAQGAERDPSAYVPELSRRARGFATWAMIRQFGRQGIGELVERHCEIARHMSERLAEEPGIQLVAPVPLNQFMVRFGGSDDATLACVKRIQDDQIAFFGPAQWQGQWVMRASVTSSATTMAEAEVSVEAVLSAWRKIRG